MSWARKEVEKGADEVVGSIGIGQVLLVWRGSLRWNSCYLDYDQET